MRFKGGTAYLMADGVISEMPEALEQYLRYGRVAFPSADCKLAGSEIEGLVPSSSNLRQPTKMMNAGSQDMLPMRRYQAAIRRLFLPF